MPLPPSVRALRAWLDSAARDADPVAACTAAAEALAPDAWSVSHHAGTLARARTELATRDLGLTADLRELDPGDPRAVALVPAGAPYPARDRDGRRQQGAFDTPPDLARTVVQAALGASRRPVHSALDPACGPGAFLGALAEAGVPEIWGIELEPAAAAVARVAVPRARVDVGDGMAEGDSVDLVVGNPPFVPPERQDKALREALCARFPWLERRFDLSVPFAAAAVARARQGGGVGLVLPSALLVQPYGRALRRRWLEGHRIAALGMPRPFPGAAVQVGLIALEVGGRAAPLPDHGLHPRELLALPGAPLNPRLQPGDVDLVARVRAASIPLGELCEVDTGVVSHGPGGGKARLLHDGPGPGRVPYVDARDLKTGRRRWLSYEPERMHRAKRPELFEGPKLLVQRLRGQGPVHAWLDTDGLYAGHTLTVVRPTDGRTPLARLLELLTTPEVDGLLRIERGARLDLYPHDVASVPVPLRWLTDADVPLIEAWGLDESDRARLAAMARPDRALAG